MRHRKAASWTAAATAGIALLGALAAGCAGRIPRAAPGALEGEVATPGGGDWAVVYLEPPREGLPAAPPPPAATLRRDAAGFSPPLLAVAAGQAVEFASGDGIHHRFFSVSSPNAFELGVVRQGAPRRVAFAHPGVVHFYCSLHAEESGTLFVAPSPWFAVVRAPGRWAIRGVPPGRYRLRTWSESHRPSSTEVTVESGGSAPVLLSLGPGR